MASPPAPSRVLRARAPLRLGLAGGGTDLSPYCDLHGGAVLNVTIDRYAYASIAPSADGALHFHAPDLAVAERHDPSADRAQLQLHRAVAERMARDFAAGTLPGVTVTSFVDAPPGSGLGSSSALVVALVEVFAALFAAPLGPYDIAHLAYEIERVDLGLAGGRQDQYAAAFGGVNFIEFLAGDRVIVNPLRVAPAVLAELETALVICFTGISRRSETIIVEQQRRMGEASGTALDDLHLLKADALAMKDALLRGEIARMGAILERSWEAKKRTASGISTAPMEALRAAAMAAGALAGKVSGAGGGGFMMFLVPPEKRVAVIAALREAGAEASGVHFTGRGAEHWVAP